MNAWRRFAELCTGGRLFAPGRRGAAGFRDSEDAAAAAQASTDADAFAPDTDVLVFFVDSAPPARGGSASAENPS